MSLEILNYLDEDIENYIADSHLWGHIHLLVAPSKFVLLRDLLLFLKQFFTQLKTKNCFALSLFFKKVAGKCADLEIPSKEED